jgi:PST family polysaccharide transporter
MIAVKDQSQSSYKKLTRNIVSLLIIQISNYALPLLSVPYFTRIVGPEKFGIINFVAAFVGYCTLITSFGFDTSATRDVVQAKEDPDKLNQLCSEVIYSKCLLLVLSVGGYVLLVFFLPQLRSELFVSLSSVLICLSIVLIPSWLYQGFQDNHILAYYNIASKIIFTIAILTLVKVEEDYILYPLFLSLSQIIIGIIAFHRIFFKYQIKLIKVTCSNIIARLQSSKSIFISFVIISLYSTSNVIIIGLFRDEEAVGHLSAALKIMVLIQACMSMPFSQALFPFIGQKFKASREEGVKVVQLTMPIMLSIGFLCCSLCCLLAPFLVLLLFGAEFSEAVSIVRVLSFIPLIVIFSQFLGIHIMVNLNMDQAFKKVTIIGAIIGLISNTLGGFYGGALGISVTYLLTELLVACLFAYYLDKEGISVAGLFAKFNKESFLSLVRHIKNVKMS